MFFWIFSDLVSQDKSATKKLNLRKLVSLIWPLLSKGMTESTLSRFTFVPGIFRDDADLYKPPSIPECSKIA